MLSVTTLISSVIFASLYQNGQSFSVVPLPATARPSSRLFLEKRIAELIDQELYRERHKQDYEREWMEKNRQAVAVKTDVDESSNYLQLDDDDLSNLRQRKKDELLAKNDPQRYCADRCIATGNCDIFEDLYVSCCCCDILMVNPSWLNTVTSIVLPAIMMYSRNRPLSPFQNIAWNSRQGKFWNFAAIASFPRMMNHV
jgi:hypothetical protein